MKRKRERAQCIREKGNQEESRRERMRESVTGGDRISGRKNDQKNGADQAIEWRIEWGIESRTLKVVSSVCGDAAGIYRPRSPPLYLSRTLGLSPSVNLQMWNFSGEGVLAFWVGGLTADSLLFDFFLSLPSVT